MKGQRRAALLVADQDGNIFEHPDLEMVGQSGDSFEPVDTSELTLVPEGTKLFYLPGSMAVGWNPKERQLEVEPELRAVTAMLQAGYTRSHLPAADYPEGPPEYGGHEYLPLWAYAAVGWLDGDVVASAFRVDPMTHSETCHYDDREIAPRVKAKVDSNPGNRLIKHLSRCALEYHCFAAKNFFMERWEAPLPTATSCNARCVGCISLQPADCCPAAQERITFVPTVEELCGVAVGHLERVERAIVSFGQGCEGEPLLQSETIAAAVSAFRRETEKGTIHLNTNGSLPERLVEVARSGLDSVRISMNSPLEATYNAYYRPKGYRHADVVESISRAVDEGLVTTLNLLVFPGVTDLEGELEALESLVAKTGLHMVHFRNLSIDPRMYLEALPENFFEEGGAPIGMKAAAKRLKRRFPNLDIGYFNRPKETFGAPLTTLEFLERGALA